MKAMALAAVAASNTCSKTCDCHTLNGSSVIVLILLLHRKNALAGNSRDTLAIHKP